LNRFEIVPHLHHPFINKPSFGVKEGLDPGIPRSRKNNSSPALLYQLKFKRIIAEPEPIKILIFEFILLSLGGLFILDFN
jgi:hypothetical protein